MKLLVGGEEEEATPIAISSLLSRIWFQIHKWKYRGDGSSWSSFLRPSSRPYIYYSKDLTPDSLWFLGRTAQRHRRIDSWLEYACTSNRMARRLELLSIQS